MSIQSSVVGSLGAIADTAKGISDIKASQENRAIELNKQAPELKKEIEEAKVQANEKFMDATEVGLDPLKDLNLTLRKEPNKNWTLGQTLAWQNWKEASLIEKNKRDEIANVAKLANKLKWAKNLTPYLENYSGVNKEGITRKDVLTDRLKEVLK